jgi:hypothetical protein
MGFRAESARGEASDAASAATVKRLIMVETPFWGGR